MENGAKTGATSENVKLGETGSLRITVVCFAAVVAAAIWSYRNALDADLAPIRINTEGFAVFGAMYVVAQAIERFLEPFSRWIANPAEAKADVRRQRFATLLLHQSVEADLVVNPPRADAPTDLQKALEAQVEVEEQSLVKLRAKRQNRATVLWAIGSSIALLACSVFGLGIIQAMSLSVLTDKQQALDVVITGLAVGAGTKPLHDLISRIEKSKTNADASTKPTEAAVQH